MNLQIPHCDVTSAVLPRISGVGNAIMLGGSLLLVLSAGRARGATYYLASDGDDSRAGTSRQQAWKSMAKPNALDFSPGDSLLFQGGAVFTGNLKLGREDGGTAEKPVVITSFGTGRATIEAGMASGVEVRSTGGVHVKNLILKGEDRRTNQGAGVLFVNDLPGAVKLAHVRITGVDASGFGRGANPGPVGSQHPSGAGIFVGGSTPDGSKSGFRDVRIENCDVHDNEYYGILFTGFYDEAATTYANENVYVGHTRAFRNSGDPDYFDNHSGSGMLLEDVDGGLVEHSQAFGNGFDCNSGAGGPMGIWTAIANNVTIQYNESFDNRTGRAPDGGGFDFDGGVTNSLMQYNYSHGNDGAGYLLYTWGGAPHRFQGNVVRYNISENDGRKNNYAGIYCENGGNGIRDCQIYNNTVYISPNGSSNPKALVVKGSTNFHIRNNVFVAMGGAQLIETHGQEGLLFQGNAYYAEGGFSMSWGNQTYAGLSEWRQASGQERLNGQPVGLQAKPGFLRQGQGDTLGFPPQRGRFSAYRLGTGSPLIDAGLDLKGLFNVNPGPVDFWGNALATGGKADIGAHESNATTGFSVPRMRSKRAASVPRTGAGSIHILPWEGTAYGADLRGRIISPPLKAKHP